MLDKYATLEQAKKVVLKEPWTDVRFRQATSGKGWVLLNVHDSILNRVKLGLFDHQCKLLCPVYRQDRQGTYSALHFSADKFTIGNLAVIFACEPKDTPLKVNQKGEALFGAVAAVSWRAYNQRVEATSEAVLAILQRDTLRDATATEATLAVQ